ncbi:MAG: hypothetical protein CMJ81_02890 [Planctomycetaceae bacterium]|nr:hypothetical protein [Planctomycetaceae bacterium]MBP60766.1 hypothetical protein [Planctomycetaceae bacterium]
MGTQFSGHGSRNLHDAPLRQSLVSPASTPPVLMRLSDVRAGVAAIGRSDTLLSQTFRGGNRTEPVVADCQSESRTDSADTDVVVQSSKERKGGQRSGRDPSTGTIYHRIAAACFGAVILFLAMASFWRPAAEKVGSQYTFPDFQMVDEDSKTVRLRSPTTDQLTGQSAGATSKTYRQTVDSEVPAGAEPGIPLSPARPPAKNSRGITSGSPTRAEAASSLGRKSVQETPDTRFKSEPESVNISGPGQLEDVVKLQGSQGSRQSPPRVGNPGDSSDSGQLTGSSTVEWRGRKQGLDKLHPGNGQMVTNTQEGSTGSTGGGYGQVLQGHNAPPVPRYPVTRPTDQHFQPRLDGPRGPLRTSQRAGRRRTGSSFEPVTRRRGAQLQGWLENPPIERSDEPYRSSLY